MAIYPGLAGKVAVVTGGGVGIGEAVSRLLVANRVKVAVVGRRNREPLEAMAALAREQGLEALAALADVSQPDEVERLFGEVETTLGAVDILVNNAGGTRAESITTLTPEAWHESLAVNLTTCFLCTRRALPGMLARGWGRIVNVASVSGRTPSYTLSPAYAAAKAGMLGFTRHVALEVGSSGVTVNATAPGITWSPRVQVNLADPKRKDEIVSHVPLGRLAEPAEQAGVIVFLTSDEAAYITGACFDVNGGMIML